MGEEEKQYVSESFRGQYNQAVIATSAVINEVGVATRDQPLDEAIKAVGHALAVRAATSPGTYVSSLPNAMLIPMLETVRAGRIAELPLMPKPPDGVVPDPA